MSQEIFIASDKDSIAKASKHMNPEDRMSYRFSILMEQYAMHNEKNRILEITNDPIHSMMLDSKR